MDWLTASLKHRIRKVFEPRYNRKLNNDEVIAIALNLTNFIEHYAKFKWRKTNEAK